MSGKKVSKRHLIPVQKKVGKEKVSDTTRVIKLYRAYEKFNMAITICFCWVLENIMGGAFLHPLLKTTHLV